jgi:hypothetical protein
MRPSGNQEDIVTTLQALRTRLSGISGGALVATLCGMLAAPAGAIPATQDAPAAAQAEAPESVKLSADQLDSLVAPIALYPDPLLASAWWPRRTRSTSSQRSSGWPRTPP